MSDIILGIESTAHTAGVGIITSEGKILSNQRSVYIPDEGEGIHPREAANHHVEKFPKLFKEAFEESTVKLVNHFESVKEVLYGESPPL